MPLVAMLSPSYRGSEPSPARNPPPKKYTSTGNRSRPDFAGVQTFRYRQSSFIPFERKPISPNSACCIQRGPNSVASRTPVQFFTGAGGAQRRLPTGGSANGIPLNSRTPDG